MPSNIMDLGLALLAVTNEAEYLKLKSTHSSQLFNSAMDSLTDESIAKLNQIIKDNPIADVDSVIKEIIGCTTIEQLKIVKSNHPIERIGDAWEMIETNHPQEALRIKQLSTPISSSDNKPTKSHKTNSDNELIGEIKSIQKEMNQLMSIVNSLNNRLNNITNQLSIPK